VISVLNKRDCPQKEIAEELDADPSTVSRELDRNSVDGEYDPEQANIKAMNRKKGKRSRRIDQQGWSMVENLIQKEWSPEQVSGWLKKEGKLDISHTYIYDHIWKDKQNGGDLYENLRHDNENRNPYGTETTSEPLKNRTSIDERPDVVDERDRVGDGEADLIIGKGHEGAMLTVLERRTRFALMRPLEGKSAEEVARELVNSLSEHSNRVRTLTHDNGGEFAEHEKTAEALDADVYFCTSIFLLGTRSRRKYERTDPSVLPEKPNP
jgi:IS30 family transposase